jgi:hypothetical protein
LDDRTDLPALRQPATANSFAQPEVPIADARAEMAPDFSATFSSVCPRSAAGDHLASETFATGLPLPGTMVVVWTESACCLAATFAKARALRITAVPTVLDIPVKMASS